MEDTKEGAKALGEKVSKITNVLVELFSRAEMTNPEMIQDLKTVEGYLLNEAAENEHRRETDDRYERRERQGHRDGLAGAAMVALIINGAKDSGKLRPDDMVDVAISAYNTAEAMLDEAKRRNA